MRIFYTFFTFFYTKNVIKKYIFYTNAFMGSKNFLTFALNQIQNENCSD